MSFKNQLELGFIYAGTLIGAGFASGQEIMRFFTVYGKMGLAGIAVTCAAFFFLGSFTLYLSIKNQSVSIRDIMLPFSGENLMLLFEFISDLFLLGGYYIMLSGCGAVLWESVKVPYLPTVAFLCMGCMLCLKKGTGGLAGFNKMIVPVMVILTLFISCRSLAGLNDISSLMEAVQPAKRGWFFSAAVYVSFNMTSACVVLSSLGTYTEKPQEAFGASFIASCIIYVMATLLYLMTSAYFPELSGVEIPLMYIASTFGKNLHWAAVIILLCAMLTTALSFGFAFAQSISSKFRISFDNALLCLFMGAPLSSLGFSDLIGYVYPLFGIIGIFFAFLLMCRRFFGFKIE
ncbi:MAG TPA: hypothetical protein GXX35_00955 [Thermoanaerobacterales bacterium]|nr:hypothetical protein [Thermoanaerobacterales bacterium]